MSFNTVDFYVFFLGVFLLYLLLNHRQQNILLLAASYVFYAWWDWRFLSLLVISSLTDYYCGLMICKHSDKKAKKYYLALSLFVGLAMLGFFKTFNFFVSTLNYLLANLGLNAYTLNLHVILPLGISFYTFKTLSYTIDMYRGNIQPIRSLSEYLLFVSFFPQLIAGPIERAEGFYPQIQKRRVISWDNVKIGTYLIYWGLFKKVFVADNCAAIASRINFGSPGTSGAEILVNLYAFAFQMYGDISGYTDIARGVAKLMGFDLSINFRLPYFSRNISDFWRRWHMSMTYWFRDYVFFPLLVYTKGNAYISSFITLLCISLWHSISLSNIYRGIYFGLVVVAYHLLKKKRIFSGFGGRNKVTQAISGFASWIVTFHLVCFGWVFFYPLDTKSTMGIFKKVITNFKLGAFAAHFRDLFTYIVILVFVEIWQAIKRDEFIILKMNVFPRVLVYWIMFWLLFGARNSQNLPFVYFRF